MGKCPNTGLSNGPMFIGKEIINLEPEFFEQDFVRVEVEAFLDNFKKENADKNYEDEKLLRAF